MSNEDQRPALLTRREAILRVSAMFGGVALVGQSAMLAGCSDPEPETRPEVSSGLFSDRDVRLLDEIAETILPETDTPGAKAAGVGAFMAVMVTDTYYEPDQQIFLDGLVAVDDRFRQSHGGEFAAAGAEDRLAFLQTLDAEQFRYMQEKSDDEPAHYFRMMKELALLGYFTSEIGCTQAMRYIESPGRYDPCTPYEPGEKIWARHA